MSVSRPADEFKTQKKFDIFESLRNQRKTKMDARAHAMAMEQVGQGILAVAEQEEKRLDAQLKGLENLGKPAVGHSASYRIFVEFTAQDV